MERVTAAGSLGFLVAIGTFHACTATSPAPRPPVTADSAAATTDPVAPVATAKAVETASPQGTTSSAAPPADAGPASPGSPVTIRSIDWCNLGYPAPLPVLSRCVGSAEERHRAGEGTHSIDRYRLAMVVFGDLTGDGREDALVVMSGEVHPIIIGKEPLSPIGWVALAELAGDRAMILDSIPTGSAPVVSVTITGGAARIVRKRAGGECTERWSWERGRLTIHGGTAGPCAARP